MKRYFINDDIEPETIYGTVTPYCFDEDELKFFVNEWGEEVYKQVHEATQKEIEKYGIEPM